MSNPEGINQYGQGGSGLASKAQESADRVQAHGVLVSHLAAEHPHVKTVAGRNPKDASMGDLIRFHRDDHQANRSYGNSRASSGHAGDLAHISTGKISGTQGFGPFTPSR